MVSSPINVNNTEPFVDNVEAMVNDVMITNEAVSYTHLTLPTKRIV